MNIRRDEGTCEDEKARARPKPAVFILLENPSKGNNLGPLIRCASGFGLTTIVAVGYDKCAVDGSHGAYKYVKLVSFPTEKQAVQFLRETVDCRNLIGLLGTCPGGYETAQIYEDLDINLLKARDSCEASTCQPLLLEKYSTSLSFPVHKRPFSTLGNTCFVLNKARNGLPFNLAVYCDAFVHVAHACVDGSVGALLDSQTCLSIALHEFTEYCGYTERDFEGQKFQVEILYNERLSSEKMSERRNLRNRQREEQIAEAEAASTSGLMAFAFDSEQSGDY